MLSPKLKIVEGVFYTEKTESTFSVSDLENTDVNFKSYLNSEGRLYISAHLSFPKDGYRSSLNGNNLYKEMIHHFGVSNIKEIQATWLEGTNFDQFHKNKSNGLSLNDSAKETWSGKQASKYGFFVKSVEEIQNLYTGSITVLVVYSKYAD